MAKLFDEAVADAGFGFEVRKRSEIFIPVGRDRREAGEGERHEVKRAGETETEDSEVGGHGGGEVASSE